ncbi:hypothetical protein [Roseibium litorale]|uniref:Uncharacterized protein n=1 Tax=Roseibium litorale TaxID=2803841 RepID=A0ABR9CN56_9HYPH|nr:hypothetical protein [Roseibium litorale]MBD8892123.1 hypothetical protein [Roseibium litorale]
MSYIFAFLSVLFLTALRGYMAWLQSRETRKPVPVKLGVQKSFRHSDGE